MSDTEQAILNALNELDTAVKSMSTAGLMPNLLPIFERLDVLASQLPERVPSWRIPLTAAMPLAICGSNAPLSAASSASFLIAHSR